MKKLASSLALLLLLVAAPATFASAKPGADERKLKLAVLDLGQTETGARVAERLMAALAGEKSLLLLGREESGAAVRGVGYAGSLNLTLEEARDLGSAIGCDFYLTGEAETLRRSSSARNVFYEAYATLFLVSARTGRLIKWDRPSFEAETPAAAERLLLAELDGRATEFAMELGAAYERERHERETAWERGTPVIAEVPEESSPEAEGLRLPAPYRRMRPSYPETAARASVEATVDVLVDIDAAGEVSRVEVVRWAGFGLDEETVRTVRRMHFRPAMRDGRPLAMRVLLRYNFQKPPREER